MKVVPAAGGSKKNAIGKVEEDIVVKLNFCTVHSMHLIISRAHVLSKSLPPCHVNWGLHIILVLPAKYHQCTASQCHYSCHGYASNAASHTGNLRPTTALKRRERSNNGKEAARKCEGNPLKMRCLLHLLKLLLRTVSSCDKMPV